MKEEPGWFSLCAWVVICLALAPIVGAQQSFVTGTCTDDVDLNKTTCHYIIFSGDPPLSNVIIPLATTCLTNYLVASPDYTFDPAQSYTDPVNGEVFGLRTQQIPPLGHLTELTVTFDGIYATGTDYAHAPLIGIEMWVVYPVPTVVECPILPYCDWSISGSSLDYTVRMPGEYAARMAEMTLKANNPVTVQFTAFEDLVNGDAASSAVVPAAYAVTAENLTTPPAQFYPPAGFNGQAVIVPGNEEPLALYIWSKIAVGKDIPAGEFNDAAIITLVLENGLEWVENSNAAE